MLRGTVGSGRVPALRGERQRLFPHQIGRAAGRFGERMLDARGAQRGPVWHQCGTGTEPGEAAPSGLPLTRVFVVPAEWVWPGLTSRSSLLPT